MASDNAIPSAEDQNEPLPHRGLYAFPQVMRMAAGFSGQLM
jgi:hypothetical protein